MKKADRILSNAELENVAAHFRVLAEPMRLRILQTICKEPRSVAEIVEAVKATQPNVSKHLAMLTAAGVVDRERRGQFVLYSLKDELTLKLCKLVHSHRCDR